MQIDNQFSEVPIFDFINIILTEEERADEAMYYLLRQRLHRQLRQRFEVYQHQLFDDFDDIIDDFFLYLREGQDGNDQQTYRSLRCIEKKESFQTWILNTFRNYLSVRAAKERKFCCSELLAEDIAEGDTLSSVLTDEEMLSVASNLIAYAHQKLAPCDRFIFLRGMLTMLNKKKAIPNKAMAKALGMTYVFYRVTVYRMKSQLSECLARMLQGEHVGLDESHQQMAKHINDDFFQLYPTLLGYYNQAIDALTCADAVKQLRQSHFLTTGNMMHEAEPPYATTLSVEAFWNKLNLFLIV